MMVFCKLTNLTTKIMAFSFTKQCWKHLFQEKESQPLVPYPCLINFWGVVGGCKSLWNSITNLPMCIEVVEYTFPLTMPIHPLGYQVQKNAMRRAECYETIQIFSNFISKQETTRQVGTCNTFFKEKGMMEAMPWPIMEEKVSSTTF